MQEQRRLRSDSVPRRRTEASRWGGFLLHQPSSHRLHVSLTGCLTASTLTELSRRLAIGGKDARPRFVLLDGSHLRHIPLPAAGQLSQAVSQWRQRGWVVLSAGFSPYLANLLVLATSGDDLFPVFSDVATAQDAMTRVSDQSPGVAQQRLSAWGGLRH